MTHYSVHNVKKIEVDIKKLDDCYVLHLNIDDKKGNGHTISIFSDNLVNLKLLDKDCINCETNGCVKCGNEPADKIIYGVDYE